MKSLLVAVKMFLLCAVALPTLPFFPATLIAGQELVLVEDGQSRAPIILFEDAPRFTRLAAEDLAEYIEKISGAKPEIIEGEPAPLPDRGIWVGYQPKLEEIFPSINFEFKNPEEILIAAGDNHIVIAGRDVWDPDNSVLKLSRGRTVNGVQSEYGTANAVYTFLQEHLHVRWLWPGALGEDIIEQETLSFEPFEYRYHPQFQGRINVLRYYSMHRRGFSAGDEEQNWTRYQRLLLHSLEVPGGHPFSGWWERFHETNPEFFALQPDGSRGGGQEPFPTARTVKLCKSNPAVWEQWLKDVGTTLERDPTRRVFAAGANDSGASGFCICEDCIAWDHPDGKMLTYRWQGIAQQYVAQTDRRITFANTLARMLKERYPDKDLYVNIGAYGNARPVPAEAVPDDNVIVSAVTNFHNRKNPEARERFLKWGKIVPNFSWRPNLGYGLWEIGFLRVSMSRAINDLKLAAENNVINLFFDTVWNHWATQGPHYYMLARMAWNPYADGESILNDYYQRGFGRAAEHVRDYWTQMEEANEKNMFEGYSWLDIYNDEFFDTAEGHLNRAMDAVEGEPGKYGERIGFVRMGLDYARTIVELKHLMDRFRASDGADTEAEDRAREIWVEKIRPMMTCDQHPHAFSSSRRPGHSRGFRSLGLFPADLENRW